MTKDEVVKAVELLYSHWNDRLPSSDAPKKAVLRAWSDFISDLEYKDVVTAIAGAALTDTYMPRPGQIRKAVLVQCSQLPPAPSSVEAWGQVRSLSESVGSGTYAEGNFHPCVLATVRQMGGIASVAVSTNGDRTFFTEAYQERVREWEKLHYKLIP
jgi:hypothetical protein